MRKQKARGSRCEALVKFLKKIPDRELAGMLAKLSDPACFPPSMEPLRAQLDAHPWVVQWRLHNNREK